MRTLPDHRDMRTLLTCADPNWPAITSHAALINAWPRLSVSCALCRWPVPDGMRPLWPASSSAVPGQLRPPASSGLPSAPACRLAPAAVLGTSLSTECSVELGEIRRRRPVHTVNQRGRATADRRPRHLRRGPDRAGSARLTRPRVPLRQRLEEVHVPRWRDLPNEAADLDRAQPGPPGQP